MNLQNTKIWGKYGKYVLERNPNVCIPTLNKPIIHLFAGEKSATRYRHFLSDRSNFKKYGDYEHYILQAIKEFEPYNKQCLDLRPVGSESADTSIADSLLDSVKELKSEEQPEIIDSQVMEQVWCLIIEYLKKIRLPLFSINCIFGVYRNDLVAVYSASIFSFFE